MCTGVFGEVKGGNMIDINYIKEGSELCAKLDDLIRRVDALGERIFSLRDDVCGGENGKS